MSLNSALNAAVSGLRGQSAAIAAVSENIANASTTAYKIRGISFKSLVNGNGLNSAAGQVGGGVLFDTRQ
jgi:flagellar hook protein FlgE